MPAKISFVSSGWYYEAYIFQRQWSTVKAPAAVQVSNNGQTGLSCLCQDQSVNPDPATDADADADATETNRL